MSTCWHRFETSSIAVILGDHNDVASDDGEVSMDVSIERYFIHPEYTGHSQEGHDLALVHLPRPAPLTDHHIQPVCLPTAPFTAPLTCQTTVWAASMRESQPWTVV